MDPRSNNALSAPISGAVQAAVSGLPSPPRPVYNNDNNNNVQTNPSYFGTDNSQQPPIHTCSSSGSVSSLVQPIQTQSQMLAYPQQQYFQQQQQQKQLSYQQLSYQQQQATSLSPYLSNMNYPQGPLPMNFDINNSTIDVNAQFVDAFPKPIPLDYPIPGLSDTERIEKVLIELSKQKAVAADPSSETLPPVRPYSMETNAMKVMMDYAKEITKTLITSSSLLAEHRGAGEIQPQDVALTLSKTLGIELPGYERPQSSYHNVWKKQYPVSGKPFTVEKDKVSNSMTDGGADDDQQGGKTSKSKRKYNAGNKGEKKETGGGAAKKKTAKGKDKSIAIEGGSNKEIDNSDGPSAKKQRI